MYPIEATRACENGSPLKRYVSAVNPGHSIVYMDCLSPAYIEVPTEASDREVYFMALKALMVSYGNHNDGELLRDFHAIGDR